jgi:lipoprotein-anchoring transpeptidase ErfK/SrfK
MLALATAAAGCNGSADADGKDDLLPDTSSSATPSPTPEPQAVIETNLPEQRQRTVPVDTLVELHAEKGTFEKVKVASHKLHVTGELSGDKHTWKATQRLEPGRTYRVRAVAVDEHGLKTVERQRFHTDDLTLDEQTYPSFAPVDGETVGVGMPVIIKFDVPVTDRASIEKHLSVETSPHQAGAFRWISDYEVHWRPKHFWKPGTDVTVHADINSVPAGNGIYGQLDRSATFHIGDSIIAKVFVKKHRMKVFVNGHLARTVPVSAGKPGFITRSGTKVIVNKERTKIMDASTIGIPKSSPEYYRLKVEYNMRVTYSGEFLHAAPWSTGEQGIANVSHGCVGMSTENARWLYDLTHGRGDVVKVFGSDRHMTLTNGYGDWVLPFDEYKQGSALD